MNQTGGLERRRGVAQRACQFGVGYHRICNGSRGDRVAAEALVLLRGVSGRRKTPQAATVTSVHAGGRHVEGRQRATERGGQNGCREPRHEALGGVEMRARGGDESDDLTTFVKVHGVGSTAARSRRHEASRYVYSSAVRERPGLVRVAGEALDDVRRTVGQFGERDRMRARLIVQAAAVDGVGVGHSCGAQDGSSVRRLNPALRGRLVPIRCRPIHGLRPISESRNRVHS